jgi:hypothetical protein
VVECADIPFLFRCPDPGMQLDQLRALGAFRDKQLSEGKGLLVGVKADPYSGTRPIKSISNPIFIDKASVIYTSNSSLRGGTKPDQFVARLSQQVLGRSSSRRGCCGFG